MAEQQAGDREHQQAGGLVRALVSVPDKFEDGDLELWLKRFKLCASANGWDGGKQMAYLPTFLRGRAFAVYERLSGDDLATVQSLEAALRKAFVPKTEESRRLAHSQLVARRLREGEDLGVYVRDLERLLDKAYPGLTEPLRSQQLLDQFLVGIPEAISHPLLVHPAEDFATTVAKARELMLLDLRRGNLRGKQSAVVRAAVQDETVSKLVLSLDAITSRLERLEARLGDKSNDVSRQEPLTSKEPTKFTQGRGFRGKCYECGQVGHRKFECPLKDQLEQEKVVKPSTRRSREASGSRTHHV
jgi:hypothetical protein